MSSVDNLMEWVKDNPITSAVIGTAVVGGGIATAVVVAKRRKKKSSKKKSKSYYKRITRRKGRQSPYTAGRGKDRSTKRIRYTKNGQPYVILKSGKARFLKKSSAKRSHRTKGGRY